METCTANIYNHTIPNRGCKVNYSPASTFSALTLTKAVDMEHIWSKYGNGMGQHMANLWALHGFYMGC